MFHPLNWVLTLVLGALLVWGLLALAALFS